VNIGHIHIVRCWMLSLLEAWRFVSMIVLFIFCVVLIGFNQRQDKLSYRLISEKLSILLTSFFSRFIYGIEKVICWVHL
jgi:hypothetical protein